MNLLMIAAAAFGVQLSARVISFITNEMTDDDCKKRNEIENNIEKLKSETEIKQDEIIRDNNDKFAQQVSDYKQQQRQMEQNANDIRQEEYIRQEEAYKDWENRTNLYWQEQQEHANTVISEKERSIKLELQKSMVPFYEKIICYLKEKANERLDYVDNLIDELKSNYDILTKYKQEQCTQLRKNAFEMLKQELKVSIKKAYAYKLYLKKYCQYVKQIYMQNGELIFSFNLPDKYPYEGAILFFSDEELSLKNGWGQLLFHKVMPVDVFLKDHETLIDNLSQAQPLYVENNDYYERENTYNKSKRRAYGLSLQKGTYYLCKRSGGFSGIPAKVKRYYKKNAILSYGQNMELTLKPQNMLNPMHYPPIGAEIIVYPMYEDYNMKPEVYYVSQRIEDTEISLSFDEIPVLIPQDKLVYFCNYFVDNKIDQEFDDAKIAPMDENDVWGQRVKIQFQDNFILCASIQDDKEKRQYFVFESFINKENGIHAEDIFVSFRATIKMYDEDELFGVLRSDKNDMVTNSMKYLIMTISKEFKLQKEIKISRDGSKYFTAWEQLTNELRQYLSDGEKFVCEIEEIPYAYEEYRTKDCIFRYNVVNVEKLKRYYQKYVKSEYNCIYFVKLDNLRFIATISPSCEQVRVTVPSIYNTESTRMKLMEQSELVIYKLEKCVSEVRQLTALHHFKAGHMSNEKLHLYALNAGSIMPETQPIADVTLLNTKLNEDISQKKALENCLCEKNWFMIQGPPGTGKTTVIRELIWQTIQQYPQARILIVSQANVAVDNVLRGLLKAGIPNSRILRCGRNDKIAEDVRQISYEYKYNNYLQLLHSKADLGDKIATEWLDILYHSLHKNADIGELLIHEHRIIGATCVGLAQKNIGLEEMTFDLVIIDEAGKALAPEILIPLNKAQKVIMIGDHKQLPPVVNPAIYDPEKIELDDRLYFKQEIFDTSFFEREFMACPSSNKTTLTTQYRMPAIIGNMVSELFYEGAIKNGTNTEGKKPLFFESSLNLIDMSNIEDYHEEDVGSPQNKYEAQYVLNLVQQIRKSKNDVRIAVITPYKGQKRKIINTFYANNINPIRDNIAIDTVDAFQGDEAEIVIYCTTRSIRKTKFFSDYRRLNVAFSRAKNELIIIASVKYLKKYNLKEPIRKVLDYIIEHNCVRQPTSIKISDQPDNIMTIPVFKLICDVTCDSTSIDQEVKYYQQYGYFSKIPQVRPMDDLYSINSDFNVYFAALELELEDLVVKFDMTYPIAEKATKAITTAI